MRFVYIIIKMMLCNYIIYILHRYFLRERRGINGDITDCFFIERMIISKTRNTIRYE